MAGAAPGVGVAVNARRAEIYRRRRSLSYRTRGINNGKFTPPPPHYVALLLRERGFYAPAVEILAAWGDSGLPLLRRSCCANAHDSHFFFSSFFVSKLFLLHYSDGSAFLLVLSAVVVSATDTLRPFNFISIETSSAMFFINTLIDCWLSRCI